MRSKITGDKKILILFSILLIFNIALFINLFAYMIIIKHVSISVLHDIVTIISAIIILGFVSYSYFEKQKERHDDGNPTREPVAVYDIQNDTHILIPEKLLSLSLLLKQYLQI